MPFLCHLRSIIHYLAVNKYITIDTPHSSCCCCCCFLLSNSIFDRIIHEIIKKDTYRELERVALLIEQNENAV